ncbi:hypothetical protein [Halobacillus sp. B23F22_1]
MVKYRLATINNYIYLDTCDNIKAPAKKCEEDIQMKNNIQWLPLVASVGIGAATYSMMTGQSNQLTSVVQNAAKMAGGFQQNSQ